MGQEVHEILAIVASAPCRWNLACELGLGGAAMTFWRGSWFCCCPCDGVDAVSCPVPGFGTLGIRCPRVGSMMMQCLVSIGQRC